MKPEAKSAHHFSFLLEQDKDGIYVISCPLFKGCHSFGRTVEEAEQNINEVIEMRLQEDRLQFGS